MGQRIRVLLVESDPRRAELLVSQLGRAGFNPEWTRVHTKPAYLASLSPDLDVILSDYRMPEFDGLTALELLQERDLDIPFVMVSGAIGEETAVAAMRKGAHDYLLTDHLTRLGPAISQALENRKEQGEKRRAATALAEAEARYRGLFANAVEGIFQSGQDGRLLVANPALARLFGYDAPEELMAAITNIDEEFYPDPERRHEFRQRALEHGVVTGFETEIRRRDGSRLWVSANARAVRGENGRLLYEGTLEDISGRKQAQHRQGAQYAVTRLLAEADSLATAAPDILRIICQTVGWEFGALWEVDRGAEVLRCVELWHVPELAGSALVEETRGTTFAIGVGLPGQVWASGQPTLVPDVRQDETFVRREAATRDGVCCAFGVPIEVEGAVSNVMDFLGRDIRPPDPDLLDVFRAIGSQIGQFVERRRTERLLLQSQKMEAVGQLAGGIAHDFSNLLGVILGYTELALRELGSEHPTRHRLEGIRQATERASGLTHQILAFSRKQEVVAKVFDLNVVVEDMEKMLRRLIGEDVRLVVIPAPKLRPVRADPGQIEQVIMNLAVNARDAMPGGGRIFIETANVELDEALARSLPGLLPGPHVTVSITDSGGGMKPDVAARIFEPFFTTKAPGKGTGLGLSVVFGVVRQSRGSISVQTEPGRGSTFRVYLPAAPPEELRESVRETAEAARGGSESILLLEDEDALRNVLAETLRQAGYAVVEAAEPQAALMLATQPGRSLDLVLTDVFLPGQTGPETAEKIRVHHPQARVLLVSGYTDRLADAPRRIDPRLPLLSKPFSLNAFLARVREVLDAPA